LTGVVQYVYDTKLDLNPEGDSGLDCGSLTWRLNPKT
jgi:hypothetical protein